MGLKDKITRGINIAVPLVAGVVGGLYSLELRAMAKAGEIGYSYWQGVGAHWSEALIFSGLFSRGKSKKMLYMGPYIVLLQAGQELMDFLPGPGQGVPTLEDILGAIGGAALATGFMELTETITRPDYAKRDYLAL